MVEVFISKLSDYLGAIEKLEFRYRGNPTSPTFIYRGHSSDSYKLLPGLFRKHRNCVEQEQQIVVENSIYGESNEKDILNAFIQEASSIVSIPPDAFSKWAEYAQHFGAPTRLLDWSSNPLVALYFACIKRENTGKVWMLHLANYNRVWMRKADWPLDKSVRQVITDSICKTAEYEYPIPYTPYYVDPRMSAQGSFFLAWGSKHDSFEDMFLTDDYQMNIPDNTNSRNLGLHEQQAFLFSFFIHPDRKIHLLKELDTIGINEKTLFPGLDGIGRYVERKFHSENDVLSWFL